MGRGGGGKGERGGGKGEWEGEGRVGGRRRGSGGGKGEWEGEGGEVEGERGSGRGKGEWEGKGGEGEGGSVVNVMFFVFLLYDVCFLSVEWFPGAGQTRYVCIHVCISSSLYGVLSSSFFPFLTPSSLHSSPSLSVSWSLPLLASLERAKTLQSDQDSYRGVTGQCHMNIT